MRKSSLIVIFSLAWAALNGCAVPSSTVDGGAGNPGLTRLQQEQADLLRRMDQLQDRLLLIEARLQDQQSLLSRLQGAPVAEKVTPGREITGYRAPTTAAAPLVEDKIEAGRAPTEVYLQAFSDYAAGRFDQAKSGFETFLGNFPDNDYAGNAQYWLGECYYSLEQYERAVAEFQKVVNYYPQGSKAPEALWKIASAQAKLNHPENAAETLRLLRGKYPGSAAARKSLQVE